jgi:hypothetical protein
VWQDPGMPIVGKPVLIDQLKPETWAKVSAWIADDNLRAKKAREEKKKAKKQATQPSGDGSKR